MNDTLGLPWRNSGVQLASEFLTRSVASAERFRRPRVALYSHDTMGLGHIRRNLLIAQALSCSRLRPVILLVTGALNAEAFKLPPFSSRLILPPFHKENNGEYRPEFRGSSLRSLVDFRSATIRKNIEEFDPDVLIVDKVSRGALRELDDTLEFLRKRRTLCILGLRDVLDTPSVVRNEWQSDSFDETIREYYDSIWIYGDPKVYNAVKEYAFPADLARKVHFTGYHDQRFRVGHKAEQVESSPYVICLVGGGQDGYALLEAFARCKFPRKMKKVVLTGPFLPRVMRKRLDRFVAKETPDFRVFDFLAEPASLIANADRVIAMGGYNTVCEVLSHEKPALIVPRDTPRREQLIRAERLRSLELVDVLHWKEAAPESVSRWLQQEKKVPRVHGRIDMAGLQRIPDLISELLSPQTQNAAGL
jgi:predicted glycosyltransferase